MTSSFTLADQDTTLWRSHVEVTTHSAMTRRGHEGQCLPPMAPRRGGTASCAIMRVRFAGWLSSPPSNAATGCERDGCDSYCADVDAPPASN